MLVYRIVSILITVWDYETYYHLEEPKAGLEEWFPWLAFIYSPNSLVKELKKRILPIFRHTSTHFCSIRLSSSLVRFCSHSLPMRLTHLDLQYSLRNRRSTHSEDPVFCRFSRPVLDLCQSYCLIWVHDPPPKPGCWRFTTFSIMDPAIPWYFNWIKYCNLAIK